MAKKNSANIKKYNKIPTKLNENQFNAFILPHLSVGKRGPKCSIPLHKVFNYILYLMHTGVQWENLPIDKDAQGRPEIHYTRIFRIFQRWVQDGSFDKIFTESVVELARKNLLDCSVLHGDGSISMAKKGGDNIGYSGHKHMKGEKVIAISDRLGNIITPYTTAPANRNESPLFLPAFESLKGMLKKIGVSLKGLIMSLDGVYDSKENRKKIFNHGMIPNIPENKRNRKKSKPGPKRRFSEDIFQERLRTIERLFAWEDKFKRLLIRFEHKSENYFGLKLIGFAMINLRHFCQPT